MAVHKPKMVSAAFVLLTVSILAVYAEDEPKGDPNIPPECVGQTYCSVKGDDYPQQEIDRLLTSNLTIIHRMKKEFAEIDIPLEPRSGGGNCETIREYGHPFYLSKENEDEAPQIIVQSNFFKQTIPQVKCKYVDAPCFKELILDNLSTKCVQKTVFVTIFIYVKKDNEIRPVKTAMDIDCVCMC